MARKPISLQFEVPREEIKTAAVDFEIQTLFDQVMNNGTNYDVDSPFWIGREKFSLFVKSTADVVISVWLGWSETEFYLWKTLDSTNDFETDGSDYYWVGEVPMCAGMRFTVSGTSTITTKIIVR